MADYRIFMLTSDHYLDAIKPYAWLLKKYWPNHPEVVVGGFTPPTFDLPERFVFHSIGKFEDYPINRWSDALMKLIRDMPDDVFIFTLEDMWIVRHVPDRVIKMCYDYMIQFEYVARLDLTGDRLNAGGAMFYGKLGDVDLVFSDPHGQYHLSTMPAFWRAKHLQRVLVPNETPWDVELSGTPRLARLSNEVIVLGTNAWPIKNTLAFRGGSTGQLLLNDIAPKDVDEMRKLGLFEGLE